MSSEMRELIEAGNKLLAAMEMQEGRESEALHIAQPTAKHLWDEAKTAWNRALLARTEAGPSLLCQSDACAHKGTVHNFCTPRTEAGADGAVAWRVEWDEDNDGDAFYVTIDTERGAMGRANEAIAEGFKGVRVRHLVYGDTHPQDASGDAERFAAVMNCQWLRSSKYGDQVLGWREEFLSRVNAEVVAMQAKEAK